MLSLTAALHFWNTAIIAFERAEAILSSGSARALLKALAKISGAFCLTNKGSPTDVEDIDSLCSPNKAYWQNLHNLPVHMAAISESTGLSPSE